MEVRYSTVVERVERLVARHRHGPHPPSQREIDDLYTDACATALVLERERLDVERRLEQALVDSSEDPTVIRRSRDLARQRVQLEEELSALSALTRGLSTAADWSRDPASADLPDLRY